jgi:ATP/maltotriose-dependent transcriptional regulator MalT
MMMSYQYRDAACETGDSESLTPSISNTQRSSRRSNHILWEKLRIPYGGNTIERAGLMSLLARSTTTGSATLISGRAGTGKTAAAAAFATQERNPAWYSLGPPDVDWGIFAAHFAAAIIGRKTQHGNVSLSSDPGLSEAEIEKFLTSVLSRPNGPGLIVMDDIHHIFDAEWFGSFFVLLIRSLPPPTHILLTCRSKPPSPLWRMRSKQVLNVVDEKVLAFDLEETETLYNCLGLGPESANEAHIASFGRIGKLLTLAGPAKQ